jgi:hemolysin activation/secretion protein
LGQLGVGARKGWGSACLLLAGVWMAGAGVGRAQQPTPAATAEPTVTITSVQWTGAPAAVGPLIDPTLSGVVGQKLTGKQLAALMVDLTDKLHQAGYVVGQVVMMAADLDTLRQTGALKLTVFPGKVGAVRVRSNSSRVNDERLRLTAEHAACPRGTGEDCILTADRIERMQLLVVDVPGVKLQPVTLSADGVPVGQTAVELAAELSEKKMWTANVSADNYGYPTSGQFRFGAGAQLTNLFGVGDIISLAGNITDKATLTGSAGFSAKRPPCMPTRRTISTWPGSRVAISSSTRSRSATPTASSTR